MTDGASTTDGASFRLSANGVDATVVARGARISSLRADGRELLFRAPWADDPFDDMARMADSSAEWHRRYSGGWHPLIPHAGDAAVVDGVAHPFHGEAGWRIWTVVETTPDAVELEVRLRTVPLILRRRVSLSGRTLRVTQRVRSTIDVPVSITVAEHPAFGGALLGPRTRLEHAGAPVAGVRFPATDERHGAFTELETAGAGAVRLLNPDAGLGVELRFDPDAFPVVWVWQEHRATRGFPWWGDGDTIGIEPSSRRYHERGGGLGPVVVPAGGELVRVLELEVLDLD